MSRLLEMLKFVPTFLPSSSSDEDVPPLPKRRKKVFKKRVNFFECLDESEFIRRFRIPKKNAKHLLSLIEEEICSKTNRNNAVPPSAKLLLTLRFYALGTMLISVGDFAGVSTTTASHIIKQVSTALAKLSPKFISLGDIAVLKQQFFKISAFPSVIGSIGCTHIRIQSPGGDRAEEFKNSKGFFSLNVQAIVGPNLKFMDIVAKWPGSAHESTILINSGLFARMESGEFGSNTFLGDGGYPLRKCLLIPIENASNEAEHLYNEAHTRTRNVVNRCFDLWKRRFPVLCLGMRVNLKTVISIIIATAVVHNIAVDANVPEPPDDIFFPYELEEQAKPLPGLESNIETRNALLEQYFSRLK